ncbi:MAG: hypothetical protein HY737_00115 [Candidatus Omnitrophica bacterium]|nr:hypothetical protein [Candidatus Omnitrophota bacterium]
MNRPGGRPAIGHAIKSWFTVGLLFATTTYVIAEEITLTTYYPSPRGVYQELRSASNTFLATQGGNVGIGTDNPTTKLEVRGGPVKTTGGLILQVVPAGGAPAAPEVGQMWVE